MTDKAIEAAAKSIYDMDPFYESGEYVDGFLVSPGGNLSWEQAKARDAEFSTVMLPITKFAYDAARAAIAAYEQAIWRPIGEAQKDGTPILARIKTDLGREDLKRWHGLCVVIRHPGLADDGFDVGWNMAAPVGHGGFPDEWFDGFRQILPDFAKGAER